MKKSIHMMCVVVLVVLAVRTAQTHAAPAHFAGTNHYYESVFVPDAGITWWDAKLAAANSTYLGYSGYLATVTSADENAFVTASLAGKSHNGWTGGFQPPGSDEPDKGWTWITGELWDYENWRGPEPNDNGDENRVVVMSSDHPLWPSVWNDVSADAMRNAYVVEYTPEPATLSLLTLGGLAVLRRRRNTRLDG